MVCVGVAVVAGVHRVWGWRGVGGSLFKWDMVRSARAKRTLARNAKAHPINIRVTIRIFLRFQCALYKGGETEESRLKMGGAFRLRIAIYTDTPSEASKSQLRGSL